MDERNLRDKLASEAETFHFDRSGANRLIRRARFRMVAVNGLLALTVLGGAIGASTFITNQASQDPLPPGSSTDGDSARQQESYRGEIAFTGTRGGPDPNQIWVVDLQTERVRKLVDALPLGSNDGTWSFDGKSLAYVRQEKAGPTIYRVDANGQDETLVASAPPDVVGPFRVVSSPTWSPDGQRIAYVNYIEGQGDIHIASMDGEDERVTDSALLDNSPSWSPDGLRLAFTRPSTDGTLGIFVVTLSNGETNQVSDGPGHEVLPAWSPDGSRIAVISYDGAVGNLALLDPETGEETVIAEDVSSSFAPTWSSDGSALAFVSSDDATIELIRADGTGRKTLRLQFESTVDPSWRPTAS